MKAWRPTEALYNAVCESMPEDYSVNQMINRMAEHWLETGGVLQNVTQGEDNKEILKDIKAGVETILDTIQQ